MKNIVILGVTGSIGLQTMDVITHHPEALECVGMSAGKNMNQLRTLLKQVTPHMVCVQTLHDCETMQKEYPPIHFVWGDKGLIEVATLPEAELVVNALVGFVGLTPTIEAIKAKKDIALANKETLVVGGAFITQMVHKEGVHLYPIDSEHSAIFQALQGNRASDVKRLIITASGGSFRDLNREQLKNVTLVQALNHPNWSMGAKITVDSATLMNKGLEVIEAHWLFDIDYEKIDVVLHQESVIHSMVEYRDHSIMAQMGKSDMREAIQYALTYPNRLELLNSESLDLVKLNSIHFAEVDTQRFPLLKLAYEVGKIGGTLPCIMNGANEVANQLFREEKITFLQIEEFVIEACSKVPYKLEMNLQDLYDADKMARKFVLEKMKD